jgi:DNA-binding NarL/FixJ family response regulator
MGEPQQVRFDDAARAVCRRATKGDRQMNVIVLTPVRLLGDGLVACFRHRPDINVIAVVDGLATLRAALAEKGCDLVLIDVTQGIDLYDVRGIAAERPDVALVALGLTEQRQEVIRCGRAGFSGYVARNASVDALIKTLSDVIEGRVACPAEISGGLLRALFRAESPADDSLAWQSLTRRESDVLELIGQGLSNKEIARKLCVSVATVKHHVHNVLDKLRLPRRAQAMRFVRDSPWIATPPRASSPRNSNER